MPTRGKNSKTVKRISRAERDRITLEKIAELCGPPPITPIEPPLEYNRLILRFIREIKPTDVVEWIWIKDIVDLIWESRRLRKVETLLITMSVPGALQDIITDASRSDPKALPEKSAEMIAYRYLQSDPKSAEIVDLSFARLRIDTSQLEARAYLVALKDIERIERLIAICDRRRDDMIREIYRRRESLGRIFKKTMDAVDAEFSDLSS